jgi:CRP/FNR family transcriptional regulator
MRKEVELLKRVPLFAELSEKELEAVAASVTRRAYPAGAIVFGQGERCRELLIVESGTVRLLKTAPNGREQLIGVERMGSTLAEAPVFDGGEYSATAQTCGPTSVLRVPAEGFQRICRDIPGVAEKIIRVLGHRLRHLDGLVEELSFSTVRGRLAALLVRLAEEKGTRTPQGLQFRLDENNEELAARLGTVRELISRNLGRLYGEGLIRMEGRMVTIADPAALKRETK